MGGEAAMNVNTFDPATLLPFLRSYLRNADIARAPSDASDLSIPPMWIDPRNGVPYPGQTEGLDAPGEESHPDVVLGLYPATGIPSKPFEGFYRQDAVTIVIRGRMSPDVRSTFEAIKPLLHDQRNYSLNGLQVNQSMMTRDLQRISSDANGFVYNCEFLFDLWDQDA